MNKINQAEQRIQELSGGEFQKLIDHYIVRRYHIQVVSLGSVSGTNKTRTGTPDALALLDSGVYIFYEHSTRKEQLKSKFLEDLEKCLDESKTGIHPSRIERLVFCAAYDLSSKDMEFLRAAAESFLEKIKVDYRVPLSVIDRSALAKDLVSHYPLIAKEHLGISVDTGQVLDPQDFVRVYDSRGFSAPLSTSFRFRESELTTLTETLYTNQAVLIHGPPGVGKTRLALEACRRFAENNPNYAIHCIMNLGADLLEDVRSLLAEPGNALLLIDDANRISGVEYIASLIMHPQSSKNVKAVVTVRSYALDAVRQSFDVVRTLDCVEIGTLDNKEIRALAK